MKAVVVRAWNAVQNRIALVRHSIKLLDIRRRFFFFLGFLFGVLVIASGVYRWIPNLATAISIGLVVGLGWFGYFLPTVTRNVAALHQLRVMHPTPREEHIRRFAEAALARFYKGRRVYDNESSAGGERNEDEMLAEITARYLAWWETAPESFTYFCYRKGEAYQDDCVGGFWLIGLTQENYEALRAHRDVKRLARAALRRYGDPECYALQIIGVVGGDGFGHGFTRQFVGSEVVLSHLYEKVRATCDRHRHIQKIGNTHFPLDLTYVPMMMGMREQRYGEIDKFRKFWEGETSIFH